MFMTENFDSMIVNDGW